MSKQISDGFCMLDSVEAKLHGNLPAREAYQVLVQWAGQARCSNPNAFDQISEWILDDAQWHADQLSENKQILMTDVIGRFKAQTVRLRELLTALEPAGVVNKAVFKALDSFENELSGNTGADELRQAVDSMFSDFASMERHEIRQLIAGGKTGAAGTDHVEIFGYVNALKECDAAVQWTLFMPDVVKNQQSGFHVSSFAYQKMPALRFIGLECDEAQNCEIQHKVCRVLDQMGDSASDFGHDMLFMHHFGGNVDVSPWHGYWGRLMKADTPVPDGFVHFDLALQNDGKSGPPYLSQFAYAEFTGDSDAIHSQVGFDSDAMYDVTRNIILGQGVCIPYPNKYWVAEVYPQGFDKDSTAYMFSVAL